MEYRGDVATFENLHHDFTEIVCCRFLHTECIGLKYINNIKYNFVIMR
jgi:hypothetical protein